MGVEKLYIEIEELREKLNELCKDLGDEKYKDKILSISMELDITEQQSAAIEETNASVEELTSFTIELDKLAKSQ